MEETIQDKAQEDLTPLERARAEQASRAGNVFGELFERLRWPRRTSTTHAEGPVPELTGEEVAQAVEPVLRHVHEEIHGQQPRITQLEGKLEAVREAQTFVQGQQDRPAPWVAVGMAVGAAARDLADEHRQGRKPPRQAWQAIVSARAPEHLPGAVRIHEQALVAATWGGWQPPYGYVEGDLGPPPPDPYETDPEPEPVTAEDR